MKKFYSIIAVASLMLTSVLSLTSCQKDELPATQAKTQTTVQAQKPVQQGTTTATTGTDADKPLIIVTTVTKDSTKVTALDNDDYFKNNIPDTSFAIGTWKATVDGTDYTLVVTDNLIKDGDAFADYTATLYVGDKAYPGTYTQQHNIYQGEFDSKQRAKNGHCEYFFQYAKFSKDNLKEFTTYIHIAGETTLKDVKFVKE